MVVRWPYGFGSICTWINVFLNANKKTFCWLKPWFSHTRTFFAIKVTRDSIIMTLAQNNSKIWVVFRILFLLPIKQPKENGNWSDEEENGAMRFRRFLLPRLRICHYILHFHFVFSLCTITLYYHFVFYHFVPYFLLSLWILSLCILSLCATSAGSKLLFTEKQKNQTIFT